MNAPLKSLVPLAVLLVLLMGAVALLLGRSQEGSEGVRATLSAAAAIAGGDTAGFARAVEPRPFVFPQDHGPHPAYRTEWWYLTGNLASEAGDPFGFQITFFRNSLAPEAAGRDSAWDTNQLWMAHFALTDVARGRHVAGERFGRGAAGMAGAEADPFRVWLGDWEIRRDPPSAEAGEDASPVTWLPGSGPGVQEAFAFPMRLRAEEDGARVDLRIVPLKPPVGQGDRGLSQKGPEGGNASFYLSWTRLEVTGTVEVDGAMHTVRGTGWLDREWSTSALSEDHVGWDWFSLQLADGRDLMFFELRRRDGAPDPLNHGILVEADGSSRPMGADAVALEVLETWASPLDGAVYPSGWRLSLPEEALDLRIAPRIRDQEMNVSFRYWEGAVTVEGTSGGEPVEGVGYVELTGYGEDEGARGGEGILP
jgi:predicted secreted hydrolase